jgi:hypothetical protein
MRQGVLHYISRTPHKICKHGDSLGFTVYILCPSNGLMELAESQTRTHSETKMVARLLLSTCLRSLSRHRMLDSTLPCCRQSRRHWKLPAIVSSRYHNSKFSCTTSRKVLVRICQTKLGVSSLSSGTVCPRTMMPTHQTTFRPIQNGRLCLVQHMICAASLLSADQRIVSISGGVSLPSNLHLPCPYLHEVVKRCRWYDRPTTLHIVTRTRSCLLLFANPKPITFLIPSGKSLPWGDQIHLWQRCCPTNLRMSNRPSA